MPELLVSIVERSISRQEQSFDSLSDQMARLVGVFERLGCFAMAGYVSGFSSSGYYVTRPLRDDSLADKISQQRKFKGKAHKQASYLIPVCHYLGCFEASEYLQSVLHDDLFFSE